MYFFMALVRLSDFYVMSVLAGPTEANTILVIYSDTVQTGRVAFEGFEAVARWEP
jgi:hypothetical protein